MQSQSNADDDTKARQQFSARRARERELERKRARGEISCAECRRLKLKCNKKVPCNSCIRRGCHTICPNGLLATGQGSRFVLANTDKLHGKLLQMSQRIRQLEDALQIAHSSISKTSHPLLSNELLAIRSGVDDLTKEDAAKDEEDANGEDEELASAMGTLAVSECGATRFIGRISAETLLTSDPGFDNPEGHHMNNGVDSDLEQRLPDAIIQAAKGFPLVHAHLPPSELIQVVNEHLPTYERATALAESYLQNVSWLPRPVQRDQIMEDLLPMIYKRRHPEPCNVQPSEENEKYDGKTRMHNVALALAVFACGAAGDLTLPQDNNEGQLYQVLALAALNKHPITSPGGASLETVQTMVLIAQYDFFSGVKSTFEGAWKTISFALVVAASIGLHRDPGHWNLDPKYIQRRRSVFWEIMCLDKFKGLASGRPSIFHMGEVDCEFPEDTEVFVDSDGKQRHGLSRWRQGFVKDVIGPISEQLCLTRPIKYSEILDFDRRIREYEDPMKSPNTLDEGPSSKLRPSLFSMQKELALLIIHRNFFARAMIRDPGNPLRGPFAPSFLCAYSNSIKLSRTVRACFEQGPELMLRLWPIWTHLLTSGIVIGSIASNVNQLALANAAFRELGLIVKLFEEASMHPVAKRGRPIILRLHERARLALQNKANEAGIPTGMAVPKTEQDETEELNILQGSARLVHRRGRPHPGSWSPTHGSPSEGNNTPRSSDSSRDLSVSPTLPSSSTALPAVNTQTTPHRVMFASTSTSGPTNTNSNVIPTSLTQFPMQPPVSPLEHDIQFLFNMIYGDPTGGLNTSIVQSSPGVFDQQPPPPPQIQYPFNISPSFTMMNDPNPWIAEASQVMSSTYGGPQVPPADAATGVTTAAPPYDMSWITDSSRDGHSEISGGAAQFVEDWCLQAAIEGAPFLAESEGDMTMSF